MGSSARRTRAGALVLAMLLAAMVIADARGLHGAGSPRSICYHDIATSSLVLVAGDTLPQTTADGATWCTVHRQAPRKAQCSALHIVPSDGDATMCKCEEGYVLNSSGACDTQPPAADAATPADTTGAMLDAAAAMSNSVTVGPNGVPALIPLVLRTLLGQVMGLALKKVDEMLSSSSVSISQPQIGAYFVTSLDGSWGTWKGQLLSAYYHPKCTHTATTQGKNGLKQSTAAAAKWAVSFQTRAAWGNKAYYSTKCK